MMHVSISRDWLFSRTARRVYFVCALLDLAFVATRIAVAAAMLVSSVSTLSGIVRVLVNVLFVPEIVGSAILFVGMSYCWLGFGGSYKKKVLWIIFVKFSVLTAPVYYLFFFRPLASKEPETIPAPALAVEPGTTAQ